MGTQRILRRRDTRTPHNSHRERQADHAKRRHTRRRNAHREVKRIGAKHVRDLEVLVLATTPESEE